jgi:hypothetical protein
MHRSQFTRDKETKSVLLVVRVVVFVLAKGLVLHARRETIPWHLNA